MHLHYAATAALAIIRQQGVRAFVRAVIDVLKRRKGDPLIPDTQQPVPSIEIDDFLGNDNGATQVSYDVGVSVVIPVLNGAKDLVKLLPALFGQQGFGRIEVIIVDSGSSD